MHVGRRRRTARPFGHQGEPLATHLDHRRGGAKPLLLEQVEPTDQARHVGHLIEGQRQ